MKFTSVVNIPGKPYEVLAVGSDRTFTSNEPVKKGEKPLLPPVLPTILSQIQIIPSARSVLAGVGEPSRPGSIQIWLKYTDRPMEKINEV